MEVIQLGKELVMAEDIQEGRLNQQLLFLFSFLPGITENFCILDLINNISVLETFAFLPCYW